MVLRGKEYIAAGDMFQVVLAQRFEVPFTLPPFSLYRAVRRVNPSPFLYFLDCGDFAVAGSIAGNSGARARWRRDDPPDRRHASTRHDSKGRQSAGR